MDSNSVDFIKQKNDKKEVVVKKEEIIESDFKQNEESIDKISNANQLSYEIAKFGIMNDLKINYASLT
jgi:hypothetical protein